MSNLVKEKITTNLDKAKSQGKIRAENIREIVKDAVAQAIAELKEGSNEIGLIVRDAISTVIADLKSDLKGGEKEKSESITASIEGAIAGSTHQRQQAIADRRERLLAIQIQLDQQQEELDRESSAIMMDIKSVELPDTNPEEISIAVDTYQERQELSVLQEQYFNLKSQMVGIDEKLTSRYGDRYQEIKQQWEKVKIWYDQKKVESETSGVIPLQQKQVEMEETIGGFGSVVARKEEQIKQNLKGIWQGKDSAPKR